MTTTTFPQLFALGQTNGIFGGSAGEDIMLLTFGLLALAFYFIPTFIAFKRKHAYKGVIFALNLCGGWTLVFWVIALIWAVFPSEKSVLDPLIGNVTGTGLRNAADSVGAATAGFSRGRSNEKDMTSEISEAAKLLEAGHISDEEFKVMKDKILNRPR